MAIPLQLGVQFTPAELWGSDMKTHVGYFGITGRGTETCEGYFGIAEHNMKTHDQAQKMLPLGKQEHYHTRTKHEHITQPKIQKPC